MGTARLPLLPYTTYGTPSGNYDGSSAEFSGDPVPAAAYYRALGVQSVRYELNDFEGAITIEATLDASPSEENRNWFPVYELPHDSSAITANGSHDVIGNFTWVRARVTDFIGGTINNITLVY